MIPKHRKVGNIREIFLRAVLKVTVIYKKHDVTLKHDVPLVLCFRMTKLDNQCVTNSSDSLWSFGMWDYAVLCKKDKGHPMSCLCRQRGEVGGVAPDQRWVVSTTLQPLYHRERAGTHRKEGCVGLGQVWTARKISPSSEFDPRTLRSIESLYWLHYPGGLVHKRQSLSCNLGSPSSGEVFL